MRGFTNVEVLANIAAKAKAKGGIFSGVPMTERNEIMAYGIQTKKIATNMIRPVHIDFFFANTRAMVICALRPHCFSAILAILRKSYEIAV